MGSYYGLDILEYQGLPLRPWCLSVEDVIKKVSRVLIRKLNRAVVLSFLKRDGLCIISWVKPPILFLFVKMRDLCPELINVNVVFKVKVSCLDDEDTSVTCIVM